MGSAGRIDYSLGLRLRPRATKVREPQCPSNDKHDGAAVPVCCAVLVVPWQWSTGGPSSEACASGAGDKDALKSGCWGNLE